MLEEEEEEDKYLVYVYLKKKDKKMIARVFLKWLLTKYIAVLF